MQTLFVQPTFCIYNPRVPDDFWPQQSEEEKKQVAA